MAFSAVALLAALAIPAVNGAAVPSGFIAVPLNRTDDFSGYVAKFTVGTPPQYEYVKIDTGSPQLAFENPRNEWCSGPTKPCARYGTYDNTTSRDAVYVNSEFNDVLNDQGTGDTIRDSLGVGDVFISSAEFGYIDRYSPDPNAIAVPTTTIVGLALSCQYGPKCLSLNTTLLPQFYNASLINHVSASFYLGPEQPNVTNAQMLLGGVYDRAKLADKPFTMPMADPFNCALTNCMANSVNITKMTSLIAGNETTYDIGAAGKRSTTALDNGSPTFYLPGPLFNAVFVALGSPTQYNAVKGYYVVDCKLRDTDDLENAVTVEFGNYGSIQVPFSELITSFGNGTCGAFLGNNHDNGAPASLGDPFLRSAYMIIDGQNFEITLAQVKHTASSEIIAFPAGGFKA